MATYIIIAIIAYAIGSINFSVIISRKMAGFDLREKGSGNAGTTNVLRTVGKKAALITLVCDILKGVVAIFVAFVAGKIVKDIDTAMLAQIAGLLVVIGHAFPIFFEFKGGKGVACSAGIICSYAPLVALPTLLAFLIVVLITKYVSLGSIIAVLTAFIFSMITPLLMNKPIDWILVIVCFIVFIIFTITHRQNIKRLIKGEESKISIKRK